MSKVGTQRLFGEHICALTTNKGLAKLAAEIINASTDIRGAVVVVAACGSWAVRKGFTSETYAIIDWRTLTLMGWETPGRARGDWHLCINWLSGPWMGDGA